MTTSISWKNRRYRIKKSCQVDGEGKNELGFQSNNIDNTFR